jgi:O-acetyl-ADP-ribose deacetylase (regulator of RNase III)
VRNNGGVPTIFINYRVHDQAGYAALLDRELARRFGPDAVFRASRSIRPGDDFVREILRNVRTASVLLAVIGPGWAEAGRSKVNGTVDWVRLEIAEALMSGVRVIPILVEDANMPIEAELPDDIAALARCQYLRLHHRSIETGIAQVVTDLRRLVPQLRGDHDPHNDVAESDVRRYRLSGAASSCRIGLVSGSIRRVRFADVWVNSENTDMEMPRYAEFSVSSIIRYWGALRDHTGRVITDVIADELAERVGARRPVAAGAAFVTGSGWLAESHNVRYVIHVAAVQGVPGTGFRQVPDIGGCVTNALVEAERLTHADPPAHSILFPLLGTGVGGAAIRPTARALLDAAVDFITSRPDTSLRTIYFLAYTESELAEVEDVLREMPRMLPLDEST